MPFSRGLQAANRILILELSCSCAGRPLTQSVMARKFVVAAAAFGCVVPRASSLRVPPLQSVRLSSHRSLAQSSPSRRLPLSSLSAGAEWEGSGGGAAVSTPRLVQYAESIVRLAFCFALGGTGDLVRARVEARSNWDVLRGRLSLLSVEFGPGRGWWARCQGGRVIGRDLDFGLGPLACLCAPLLAVVFRPNLLAVAGLIYVMRKFKLGRGWLGGAPCRVEFTASLSSEDLEKSRLLRPLLRAIVETLVTSSPLSQFPGPLSDPSTRYSLRKASFQGDRLVLAADASFGAGASTGEGRATPAPASVQEFVVRTTITPSARNGDSLEFLNPELHASFDDWTKPLGLKLPDMWIPLVSGVVVGLGPYNRLQAATIQNSACDLRGSVNLNGYEDTGDTATLLRLGPGR